MTKTERDRQYREKNRELIRERSRGWSQRYREAHRERVRLSSQAYWRRTKASRAKHYAARVRRYYGLTMEQYREMLSRPCWICGATEGRRCVDHSHATKIVRGTLCVSCNAALGSFRDDIKLLQRAIEYLCQS